MPLPKISTPTYELGIAFDWTKQFNIDHFLVKEEKLLVIALESETYKQRLQMQSKHVIKDCILTKGT
jgi:hypothetical protein